MIFIDSLHFLNNSLNNFVENLRENDFYYLDQELDANVLYSVKKKEFFPYDYCDSFEKFNEDLPNKDKLYSSLTNFEISDEHYEQQVVIIENYLE